MNKKTRKYISFFSMFLLSIFMLVGYNNCSGGLVTSNSESSLQSPTNNNSNEDDDQNDGNQNPPPPPPADPSPPTGTIVQVANSSQLAQAIANASPGHVITLASGVYVISQKLNLNRAGTASEPITIRAAQLGQVTISVNADSGYAEGFVVNAPYWIIENLDIHGTCPQASHSFCEHAVHVKGNADHLIVRNNTLRDFNAMIKGSGNPVSGSTSVFADDVLIKGNRIQNSSLRMTSNPVALIDINGGQRWRVQENTIADFGKGSGDNVSYGAFLKGNSRDGIFERNLVVCSKHHSGTARIGLSFGGGGNLPEFNNPVCEQNTCTNLHTNGIIRNNVIVNCSDVGIYLNRSAQTKVYNNTLINTNGIDVRFATSSADIRNNVSNSMARARDGGTIGTNSNNIWNANLSNFYLLNNLADLRIKDGIQIYGQGAILIDSPQDHCGQNRQISNDIGAIQYNGASSNSCSNSVSARYSDL